MLSCAVRTERWSAPTSVRCHTESKSRCRRCLRVRLSATPVVQSPMEFCCFGRCPNRWRHLVEKVNVAQKFDLFSDYWSPKIAAELNDSYVKLAKLKGEFVWHHHENEDELFLVTKGQLLIKLRDRSEEH